MVTCHDNTGGVEIDADIFSRKSYMKDKFSFPDQTGADHLQPFEVLAGMLSSNFDFEKSEICGEPELFSAPSCGTGVSSAPCIIPLS